MSSTFYSGVLTMKHGNKTKTVDYSTGEKEEIHKEINGFVSDGWKSNSVFYLDGSVKVDLVGKNYGVKASVTGTIKKYMKC